MLRSNLRSLGNENGLFEKKSGGYLAIVALILFLAQLRGIDVGGSTLGDDGFRSFPDALTSVVAFKRLDVSPSN